jgi:hypothetical protein
VVLELLGRAILAAVVIFLVKILALAAAAVLAVAAKMVELIVAIHQRRVVRAWPPQLQDHL